MSRISKLGACAGGLALILMWGATGCGSGSSHTSPPIITVTLSPSPNASMNLGSTLQFSATVTQNKTTISTPITFFSNNRRILQFSPGGLACGGTWDLSFIVCNPGMPGAVRVFASGFGTPSSTTTVYVHPPVTRIVACEVSAGPCPSTPPPAPTCISQGQTQNFQATVYSGNSDITPFVGPVTWSALDPTIAKASTTASGLQANQVQITAGEPGLTRIFPTVSGVTGQSAAFETCPVQSLSVSSAGTDSLSLSKGSTAGLASSAVDTLGQAITPTGLTWLTSQPGVATARSGSVSAINPGGAAAFPVCAPPGCNGGLYPVYSSTVVSTTVTGSATAANVYVTSTGCLGVSNCQVSVIPISTQSNTAGTAISLPAAPNSMIMGPTGTDLFLGTASGLRILSFAGNTLTPVNTGAGKVLAVSLDGTQEVVSDTTSTPNVVYVVNSKNSTSIPLLVSGVTAAAFSPDGSTAYLLAGGKLYIYPIAGTLQPPITLPGPATDAVFLTTGTFGFVGSTASSISLFDGCDFAAPLSPNTSTVSTVSQPTFLAPLPDGRTIAAATSPGLTTVELSTSAAGCPPPVSVASGPTLHDFGQGPFTPKQLLISSDGMRAYVISNLPEVLIYDFTAQAVRIIPLIPSATPLAAALTLSGQNMYVGASDGTVHVLDTSTLTDTGSVPVPLCSRSSVSCPPDLVALRP